MSNRDYDYINKFKEISIREICKELYLDPSNLYAHRMNNYHVHKVRVELENRVNKLSEKETRKIRSKKKRIRKKRG